MISMRCVEEIFVYFKIVCQVETKIVFDILLVNEERVSFKYFAILLWYVRVLLYMCEDKLFNDFSINKKIFKHNY